MKPLNPTLFRLLELRFGSVEVVAQGQAMSWTSSRRDVLTSRAPTGNDARLHRKVINSGEEYKVSCPFCGDNRKRLYINHMWGVLDEETSSKNLFLCQCFNEQCMDGYDRQAQLHEQVFASSSRRDGKVKVFEGRQASNKITEVSPPGPVVRMDEMLRKYPDHPAIQFLLDKEYDPKMLGQVYKIGYCPQSKFSLAQNRIIIPIYHGGKLSGWQARYIGKPPSGVAKFWSCPGMARRLLAYNFDKAVRHQTIAVVEGPGDVWGFGPQALGLLGKTMNPALVRRFVAAIQLHAGDDAVVIVMLDPEQDPKEKQKGKPHHIDKLVHLLQESLGDRVFGVMLPEGTDPGSLSRKFLRTTARKHAEARGLHISFSKGARR